MPCYDQLSGHDSSMPGNGQAVPCHGKGQQDSARVSGPWAQNGQER